MRDWRAILSSKRVLIADGAWGTEMVKRGLAPGEPPELWNLERPEVVKSIAQSYKDAGADIILTNTFGGNYLKLEKRVGTKRARDKGWIMEINRRGVELSRESAGDTLVFASLGPTGEFLEPLGRISEEEMVNSFAQQVRAFVEGGADGVVIETMSDLNEAKCALRAVKEYSLLPVAVTMTFNKVKDGFATITGLTPERAVRELEKAGADMVGANCGSGMREMVEITRIMRPATSLPLWIKPNAGSPLLKDGKTIYPEGPEEMARYVPELIEIGASIIGGCCGTSPEYIRLFVEERRRLCLR